MADAKVKVTQFPLLTVLATQDMVYTIKKEFVVENGLIIEKTYSRQASQRTHARFARPPISLFPGAAVVGETTGGVIMDASGPDSYVTLPPLSVMLRQSVPIFNPTPFPLAVHSAAADEPFRLPDVPPSSTYVVPPWGSAEFRPIVPTDKANQGWFPRSSPPQSPVLSVAGKTGAIWLSMDDIAGLAEAMAGMAGGMAAHADRTDNPHATTASQIGAYTTSQVDALLAAIAASLSWHADRIDNPHAVTKEQVGLGHADDTSDAAKPISTATQAALDGKAAAFHGHAIVDVVGLQASLASKAPAIHAHAIADVSGLQAALDAKAGMLHGHAVADVYGLQATLDGKALASHTHPMESVVGLSQALDAKLAIGGNGGSLTGLTAAQVGLGSVDNTSDSAKPISTATATALAGKAPLVHTHPIADVVGLQSALDAKASASHGHPISAIADLQSTLDGKLAINGNGSLLVGLSASQVGLGNVDNTADANKPISSATAAALAGKAPLSHTHPISDVVNLQSTLDAKASLVHGHAIADVSGLQTALAGKAATSHTHAIADVVNLQSTLDAKAALSHTHAIAAVTNLQSTLDAKAALVHTHAIADVSGLQAALDGKAATTAIKTTISVGTLTRAAATASGNESVTLPFLPAYILFSALDDGDNTVSSDGWDDGANPICTYTSSSNVLLNLLGGLTLAATTRKSHAASIWVQNSLGVGHSARVSAKSSGGFTLAWTRIGLGRPITVRYIAVQ